MATIEATPVGGSWAATTTWVGAVVPGEGDDVVLSALSGSVECPSSTVCACRSLEAGTYTKTLTLKGEMNIGASTSNGGLAIHLGPSMTLTGKGGLGFLSTATEPQHIKTGSLTASTGSVSFEGTAVYVLDEECGFESFTVEPSATLRTEGHKLTATATISCSATLYCGASTIEAAVFKMTGTVYAETSTIITSTTFAGGGQTYNKVILTGTALKITGTNTFAELQITGKEAVVVVTAKTTQTVGKLLVPNTTETALITIESVTTAAFKLNHTASITVAFVKLKDCTAEGTGTATDEYGKLAEGEVNQGGNTGWTFKAEAKGKLEGTITASTSFSGKAQAKGNAKGTVTALSSLAGKAQAKGDLAGTIAADSTLAGDLQGTKGTLSGTLASGSNLTGDLQAPGRLAGDLPVLSSFSGRLAGFGHLAGELVAQSAWSGMAQARGVLRGVLDVVVELTGRLAHPHSASRASGFAGLSRPTQTIGLSSPTQRTGRSNPSQRRGETE